MGLTIGISMKRLSKMALKISALSICLIPALSVAQSSENFENKWHVSSSMFQCEIKYDLTGFGEAYFTKKSGNDLSFRLSVYSPERLEKNKKQELILYVKNPDWVESGQMRVLGSVPYVSNKEQAIYLPPNLSPINPDEYVFVTKTKVKNDIKIKIQTNKLQNKAEPKLRLNYELLTPNQLWQTLEAGNNIVFLDPKNKRTQLISVVGFRDSVEKFQSCVANMVPQTFDNLKSTRLYFPSGSAAITTENKEKLDILIDQILHDEYISKIELGGHSDIVGGYTDNRILANRRLWAIKDYLVFRGVPNDLIEAHGYGDTKPIAPHNSKEGRAKNRRVEIKLYH